jgi:hypothetical protein
MVIHGITGKILWILSFARLFSLTKGVFDMKATGIVRRIDDYVIIGSSSESLENTVVSLILSNFTNKWRHSE